jgi:Carboxypeptidase regulatory-like domain
VGGRGPTGRAAPVAHFDGIGWDVVPSPTPGDSGVLVDVEAESTSHLWAVGTANGGHSLVEESPSRFDGTVTGGTGVAFATVSWFGSVSGSVQTDVVGGFAAAGLPAGTYTFIATEPGCSPAQAQVTVIAGTTLEQDLPIDCLGAAPSRSTPGRSGAAA